MSKNLSSLVIIALGAAVLIQANAAASYKLGVVCKKEPNVTYNRVFYANDDMDAQNKARAILMSNEFQSKGGCTILNLNKG
jgi:hypothetical protein